MRGLFVSFGVGLVIFPIVGVGLAQPVWGLLFVLAGSALMALVGLIAGILAQKFDHLAALTNFVVTPLSFLSGTFYSIEVLPAAFQTAIQINPIFHLIDGMRYAALGTADSSPALGLAIVLAVNAGLAFLAWRWLASGFRLKT